MEGLMQKAGIATYRAKQAGGDAYCFADGTSPAVEASTTAQPPGQCSDSKPTH
jgi:hypothetical protein